MNELLETLLAGKDLTSEQCEGVLEFLLKGENRAQKGAFLALLRAKGESEEELFGLARALRARAKSLSLDFPTLDIVGTGGDGKGTVNLSTGSALLAAMCGVPIVKHGNRAVSSKCGSADVLEALGIDLHASAEKSVRETGFGFCFAPDYHPALLALGQLRRELAFPTVFNLLGPLLNPAGLDHLQIGVFSPEKVPLLAKVLFRLGTKRSLIFHAHGLDELSCLGPIEAFLVTQKGIEPFSIDPEKLGLKKCSLADLRGGDAEQNSALLRTALSGASSPLADTLVLNAAVALFLYGKVESLEEGVVRARERLCRKSLKEAIRSTPSAILAEIKRGSPSAGAIGPIEKPGKRAQLYVAGGAAAISVLTDSAFQGSLSDLREVAEALSHTPTPILRKGFFLEREEILRARLGGAHAILLIASRLQGRLSDMIEEARKWGLEALVEVHTEGELALALESRAEIIGVNQRDLTDFSMHPETFEKLGKKIPPGIIKIAESGIRSAEDAKSVRSLGFEAILVGEALTRTEEPLSLIAELRGACAR